MIIKQFNYDLHNLQFCLLFTTEAPVFLIVRATGGGGGL